MCENSKYHEIDDSVKIDFKVPKDVQSLIDDVEEADITQNGMYDILVDGLDILCKNCCVVGHMTTKQWNIIMMRYKI